MPILNTSHGRPLDFYQHVRQNTWTGGTTVANVQKQWFSNLLYQTDCLLFWSKIQFQILPIACEVACMGVYTTKALLGSLNFILEFQQDPQKI